MTHLPKSEGANPREFAGYELVSRVEVNGGAATYKALQVKLGRPVFLTVMPAEVARLPLHRTRFERQVQITSRLRHENVISAIDAGVFKGCHYFVTEYVEGHTLADELKKRRGPLHVERAVTVARDVARALAYVETAKLVHRNVSPDTILLTDGGPTKLTGFGAAKDSSPTASETWVEHDVKSARYVAPEFLRGDKGIDSRADVYSLGCVLYHMLTGMAPFDAKSAAVVLESHATRPPTDPRELARDLPDALVEVLDRCLRKRREHRYQRAEQLAADLEAVRLGRPISRHTGDGALWPPAEPRKLLPRIRRGR